MSTTTSTPTTPTQTQTTRRPGRPQKPVDWPAGQFTINDLKSTGLSRVSLQLKVQRAVREGSLRLIGSTASKSLGRPSKIYEAVVNAA